MTAALASEPDVAAKIAACWERFVRTILNPTVPVHTDVMSDEAFAQATTAVEQLQAVTLTEVARDSTARTQLRLLPCLFPEVTDRNRVASYTFDLLANPNLSWHDVRTILDGNPHETPVPQLQYVARLVQDGTTRAEAARIAGVSEAQVKHVMGFLGVVKARRQRLVRAAIRHMHEGRTYQTFVDQHGGGAGRAAWNEARATLAEEDDL